MSNVKVLIAEKDGVELAEETEYQLLATDIPFDATGTQYSAATVQAALVEAKEILIVTVDPSVAPGVAAPLGTLSFKKTVPVGFWQKRGDGDTEWRGISYNSTGGSGVTPPFVFSKSGFAHPGTYLRVGEAVTSNVGQIIKGLNYIVEIAVTNGVTVNSTTRVQFQKRTGVSTFVDIANAYIDIASGGYKATRSSLQVALAQDEEVSSYVKSGSQLSNPVVMLYLIPQ